MKLPFLKLYTSDWRSEPRLKMCSMAARGLWIELICLMHEASPYGHLLVNGQALTDAQLGALVGAPPEQITALLGELETAGVFSRTRAGVIYSRKLIRMAKKTVTARNNGRKGGNPSLLKQEEILPSDNQQLNHGDKPQKPEARIQKKEEEGACAREEFFDRLLRAANVTSLTPYWTGQSLANAVVRWEALGLSEDQIIAAAAESRKRNPEQPDGPKALDRWMEATARSLFSASPIPAKETKQSCSVTTNMTVEQRVEFWAEKINSASYVPPSAVTPAMARSMIERGLVTAEQLRTRGIAA